MFNKLTSTGAQLTVIVYVQSSLDWFAAELTAKYGKVKTQAGEVVSWVGNNLIFKHYYGCFKPTKKCLALSRSHAWNESSTPRETVDIMK